MILDRRKDPMQRADNEGNFFLIFFFRFFSFFGSFFILDNFSGAWQQLNRRLHNKREGEGDAMQKREGSSVRESAHGMNLFCVSTLSQFLRSFVGFFFI